MSRICLKSVLFSLSTIVCCSGCDSGSRLYPVKGTLTVKGRPAENAVVFMHRIGRSELTEPVPYGTVDANGEYNIVTPFDKEGALPGDYVLTFYYPDMSKAADGSGQRPDLLNGAHDKPGTSRLTMTVRAEPKTVNPIDLVPGPPPRRPVTTANNK